MADFAAPLRLHLDGGALVANWHYLQRQGSAACGAAVKADGYGLGAREVVKRLRDAGCRDFFVAHWNEAVAIADLVPPEWISVFNGFEAAEIPLIRDLGAIPVINTPRQVAAWKASGGGRCHVMLDTGINRLGIGPEQFSDALLDQLDIDILMSHLASADEDSPQNAQQLARFQSQAQDVKAKRRSLANSAGIMLGPEYHFDLTRPGLSLYGGVARAEMASGVTPVVRIMARILQVRQLDDGDAIGYNATYVCQAPTKIATLSFGYADGYLRCFSSKGVIIADGKAMPVIGRVSMDLITAHINSVPTLTEGDWVDVAYDLPEVSALSGVSQYELLTGLGNRFKLSWL